MDNLPYIIAAYGLTIVFGGYYAVSAWLRMGRARRRLAAIDPRAARL